jgi:iron(II)-dependent oxidoreductase
MDMAGNVAEWCSDAYDEWYYKVAPDRNPPGPSAGGLYRCSRGGSWVCLPRVLMCAYRGMASGGEKNVYIGFRCAK